MYIPLQLQLKVKAKIMCKRKKDLQRHNYIPSTKSSCRHVVQSASFEYIYNYVCSIGLCCLENVLIYRRGLLETTSYYCLHVFTNLICSISLCWLGNGLMGFLETASYFLHQCQLKLV